MPDYKKGKIYTIRCKTDDSLIYVGSTVESLSTRLTKHKFNSKLKPQIILYSHVQDWNDWYIELYEDFPCERKEQLLQREGQVIREIGTLNKIIQGRTKQEYQQDNKDKMKECQKTYREANKNKAKEYREDNKEYYQKYNKQWIEDNKEKIKTYNQKHNETYSIKITCDCGCIIRKGDILRHKKSNKHINIMKTLEVC
jgi:hypothetical protein